MLELVGKFLNGTPWAITTEMFSEIQNIYRAHTDGKVPDIAAIEAQLGRPLKATPPDYEVTAEGIAILPVTGVISKRMNMFQEISGGCSIEQCASQFKTALDDPAVSAILLKVDSPGGSIDGVFEFADMIYNARDAKPIVCLAYGQMCSAAYLIGAAASAVYASDVATVVGSIGVVAVHQDTSSKRQASGVVTTEVYRGKYKRIVTDGPLTDEGLKSLEEKVDYCYSLFVNDVARFRGVDAETVLNTMSTDVTDYFIGRQAVDAGLVDGIETMAACVDRIAAGISPQYTTGGLRMEGSKKAPPEVINHLSDHRKALGLDKKTKKEAHMGDAISTLAELETQFPGLVAEARRESTATALTQGAAEERTKILAVINAALGDEQGTLIAAVINADGPAAQIKALRDLEAAKPAAAASADSEAEKAKKTALLEALKGSGAAAVGADTNVVAAGSKDYMTLVNEYAEAHKVTRTAAMKVINRDYPDARKALIIENTPRAGRA
jgi:signal peptide peptidase SppA